VERDVATNGTRTGDRTRVDQLEQFLAMLSHELRNPLAAVLSATALLESGASETVMKRCHAVIKRQSTHMNRLLDDLLDVSRITTGKLTIHTTTMDLRDAIATAIESTAPLFAERRIRLESNLPDRPLPVKGDARRLTQVVVNLLANAATYSPPDTVVVLGATTSGGRVVFSVRDQGEGIAPELQPKIFDLFVQSKQKLDLPRGGLGLGLSLAKAIVELHGGTIAVETAGPGKGSEFRIELAMAQIATAPLPTVGLGSPCRIIVVDDQDDSRDMLRMLLERYDHVVYDAADGEMALQLIAQHKPDVAFIDIGLPVMNGLEVAQQVRERNDLKDVMLVALSGYGHANDVREALAAGFDEHLTKPAALETLKEILARRRPLRQGEP
jgi:CheY-like chemotaxis protein/two-component sensor histidine kinase